MSLGNKPLGDFLISVEKEYKMNNVSEDIKDILESESSLGLTYTENLFVGREPASLDNVVTIYDTPGDPLGVDLDGGNGVYFPAVQIAVRNLVYNDGLSLLREIAGTLHGRGPEVWNGTTYMSIKCYMEPGFQEWDDNDRARFVTTFNIERK